MFQKNVVEKIKTHILRSITFFSDSRTIYEIMWKNMAERGRPQMTVWRMRITCWIIKATYAHFVICNADFPLLQWLHEHLSVLCSLPVSVTLSK